MSFVSKITHSLPITTEHLSHAMTALATASFASLCYGSPMTAIPAGIAALATYGLKRVRESEDLKKNESEKEEITKKVRQETLEEVQKQGSVALSSRVIKLAKQCAAYRSVKTPENTDYTDQNREEMEKILTVLREFGVSIKEGGDHRAVVVGLQEIFEHVMKVVSLWETLQLNITIHTPMPPTPLCTKVDLSNHSSAMNSNLLPDLDTVLTVKKRVYTLREILNHSGTKMYAIFSQGGLKKRDAVQQAVFKGEVESRSNLVPIELEGSIDPSQIGATYIIATSNGIMCVCIDAPQADTVNAEKWGVYCGPIHHPIIQGRVAQAYKHILEEGGPDLYEKIKEDFGITITNVA